MVNKPTPLLTLTQVSLPNPSIDTPPLLEQINWTLHHGERWAIVGSEGCGKTTLLRLMAGLQQPNHGTVLLNNQPYANCRHRAECVAVLFCDPSTRFLTPVVWEEIILTLSSQGLEEAVLQQRWKTALQQVGLPIAIGKRALASLSTAEGARVALATVLAVGPQLLLADEPGSQLSTEGEISMAKILATHAQNPHNMASVIFTSRMERARRFADRFLHLANGCLTALS